MWINRQEAGRQLADKLLRNPSIAQANRSEMIVLSIPRGGVVIGDGVATTLRCAHDVVLVKKIGFPEIEELAIGAVAEEADNLHFEKSIESRRGYGTSQVAIGSP